jgi:hypothetical protein
VESKGKSSELLLKIQEILEIPAIATSGEQYFRHFLARFGWDAATVNNTHLGAISAIFNIETSLINAISIIEMIENNIGSLLQNLQDLLNEIETIIDSIQAISSGVFAGLPAPLDGSTSFWNDFPRALFDYLLIEQLKNELPLLEAALRMLGITEIVYDTPAGAYRIPYYRHTVYWNKLGDLLTKPVDHLKDVYKWDHAVDPFEYGKLCENVANLFRSASIHARVEEPSSTLLNLYYSPGNPVRPLINKVEVPLILFTGEAYDTWAQLGILMMPITPAGLPGNLPNGFIIAPSVEGVVTPVTNPNDADISLRISGGFETDAAFRVEVRPEGITTAFNIGVTNFFAEFMLVGKPSQPYLLIGSANSHRIELDAFKMGVEARGPVSDPELIFEVGTNPDDSDSKLRFVFQPSDGDSFINKVVGTDPITLEFDGTITWSTKSGLGISGHAGFLIELPLHKSIGPLTLENLRIAGSAGTTGDAKIIAGLGLKLEIGPVTAVVDNIGAAVKFVQKGPGDPAGLLGNVDMDWSFNPPNGIGLSVDSDAVKGAGYLFFDHDEHRYGGAVELSIKDKISLKAIGILTTRLPGNQPGWSLLLMITAEFQPIQLGFGFTLNGVGGLVALHRTMNFNALRDGVRNNSLDNILFPTDPVANISSILSTLESVFPIQENRYSFGPMAIIGWGTPTLITAEVGLFIEVPDPVRIAIIGVIKAILPDENTALLKLQINFVGTIDFEAKDIFFYAALFDSKLAWFSLEGSMAFRLRWGNDPIFVLSVGGFHPSFDASGLGLPALTRITLNLLGGDNPRLTLTNYFAITSNTVQFGAAIDFYFKVTNKIKVLGHLGFDALFQFNPFRFLINVAASLGVYKNDNCLLGVSFSGSLEGPSPWRVRGTGTFKIVIEFSINFDKTFGDNTNASQQNVAVMPQLQQAIQNKTNWQGITPAGYPLLVTVRELGTLSGIVVYPNSSMAVSQKVVPLGYTINKFGSARPSDYTIFDLEIPGFTVTPVQEFFARGEFTQLSDGQRLSTKSFEKFKSGLEVKGSDQLVSSTYRELQVEYDTIYMDSRYKPIKYINNTAIQAVPFSAFIRNNAAAKSPLGSQKKPVSNWAPAKVNLKQEGYAVAQTADLALYSGLTAASEAEAEMLLNDLLQQQPELEGKLQVVSSYELA